MSFQSIVPPEALEQEQPVLPPEEMSCPFGHLQGYRNERGEFVVSRLISTDPAAYLDSKYAPNSVVKG